MGRMTHTTTLMHAKAPDPGEGFEGFVLLEPVVGLEPTTCCLRIIGSPVRPCSPTSFSAFQCGWRIPPCSPRYAPVHHFGYMIGYMNGG
jgi:hypothetical protein